MALSKTFARAAQWTCHQAGRSWTFFIALGVVVVWAITGPVFGYSDTWQLVINTGTTVITFLMVFLIQNAQNRDTQAIQIKLDELIRATHGAHNKLIALEERGEEELARASADMHRIAEAAGLPRKPRQRGEGSEHHPLTESAQDAT